MKQTRRAIIWTFGSASVLAFNGQAAPARPVPISARGREAIGRMRGRVEFSLQNGGFVPGAPVFLRVIKDQARIEAFVRGRNGVYRRYRAYRLCGGGGTLGPRMRSADDRIAEGVYAIGANDLRPSQATYLGLSFGWPNARDAVRDLPARPSAALIQAGCSSPPHMGLADTEIEDLYTLIWLALVGGQSAVPLHVFPFAMSGLNMLAKRGSPHLNGWKELEPIWNQFERTKTPPVVQVQRRRYEVRN